MDESIPPLLKELKKRRANGKLNQVVTGVITNSDPRVPGILTSFGLNVNEFRFGAAVDHATLATGRTQIDFTCMSYDVGFEKPDARIFNAAETMAKQIIKTRNTDSSLPPPRDHSTGNKLEQADKDLSNWLKIYVGDDFNADLLGALGAGWNAVLLSKELIDQRQDQHVTDLESHASMPLDTVFHQPGATKPVALRVSTLNTLLEWLIMQSTA
jgi:hypothetical protein